MYANLRVKVNLDGRSAEYGASEVRIDSDNIVVILDSGEKEESPGRLTLDAEADVTLFITADY